MSITTIIQLLEQDITIAYKPIIAKACKSTNLSILWCQLKYWSGKTTDVNGWIYKTQDDIYQETGMHRKQQETARRIARDLGVIEEKLAGRPATVHFKLNVEKMAEIINEFLSKKDKKEKQLKIKPECSIAFLRDLSDDVVKEMIVKYGVTEKFVKDRADDVIDYCEAKGKTYRNYKAALRNFIKTHRSTKSEQKNRLESKTNKYDKYTN